MLSAACGTNHKSDKASEKNVPDKKEIIDLWRADSIAYLYWGSPESPYKDEGRYIMFLDSLLAVEDLPEELRERALHRRHNAMLNRPGSIATDFRFLERGGSESSLHKLTSPMTLLLFYDPECPHCNEILHSLSSSKAINEAIEEKELTVVAIYAEGKRDVWNRTCADLPGNWLVGYDLTGILDNDLYNLPAMPIPYLLDKDKRVILKDPNLNLLVSVISDQSL